MTAGYLLKMQRAHHHLTELELRSSEWFTPDTYSIFDEPDPDGPYQRRVRVVLKKPVVPDDFSVIIGDILYGLRSALDNLAFDLNGGDANAQQMANESEFPIFGNENRAGHPVDGTVAHSGQVAKKIRCMCQDAQTHIKGLQPYNRGDRYREHPLWHLHTLCNIDKHRKVHAVAGTYSAIKIAFDKMANFSGKWDYWSYTGPLKTETVIVRYTAYPTDAKREVEMNLEPTLDVGLAERPVMMGHAAVMGLTSIYSYIADEAIEPLSKFL